MIKNKTFMDLARIIGDNSKCCRAKVGAILVKDNRIISTGYNGKPSGWNDNDCTGDCKGCKETIHAEINTIIFAAKNGMSTKDCVLYVTHSPCQSCCLAIIQAGIKVIFFEELYVSKSSDGEEGIRMLKEAGIKVFKYEKNTCLMRRL